MGNPTPTELLNIESLKFKIQIVDTDLKKLQADAQSPRKVEALTEYKKYLEDELSSLENG